MPCRLPSNSDTCVTRAFAGSVAASTAKPWFWLVMSTCPVSRSSTGWFAPWWPNFIFSVRAPDGEAQQLVAEADAERRHAGVDDRRGSRAIA